MENLNQFALATAYYNNTSYRNWDKQGWKVMSEEDAKLDTIVDDVSEIVETRDSLLDFTRAQGAVVETLQTPYGELHIIEKKDKDILIMEYSPTLCFIVEK